MLLFTLTDTIAVKRVFKTFIMLTILLPTVTLCAINFDKTIAHVLPSSNSNPAAVSCQVLAAAVYVDLSTMSIKELFPEVVTFVID